MSKRILVLAPHTDDGEFGCGGSIASFIEEGKEVHYVAFSLAEKADTEKMPDNILEMEIVKETEQAIKVLGIQKLTMYKFQVRKLDYARQEILDTLVKIRKETNPDLVFIPSPNDLHQDHRLVALEAIRVFKQITILAYEVPWNNIVFNTQAFICLKKHHIEKKVKALKVYKSQSKRYFAKPDFIWHLAGVRRVQADTEYAEAFEVIRWMI